MHGNRQWPAHRASNSLPLQRILCMTDWTVLLLWVSTLYIEIYESYCLGDSAINPMQPLLQFYKLQVELSIVTTHNAFQFV